MYSSRTRSQAILIIGVFLAALSVIGPAELAAQQAAPPAQESAPADTDKQAEKPAASPAKPAVQPEVPWDGQIERIVAQRYPKGVDDLRRIQSQVQAVVKHARPAVVAVQLGSAVGSGVIVSEDGLVLTAGHVATEPNRPVTFRFPDGKRARGVTLGVNRSIDSGMMQITDKGPWPHVEVADSDSLSTGDWVVGLGQPNGFYRDRAPPIRVGRVLYKDDEVVNTDVALVGGDSGGPLLNLKGQVVGIHSRIGRRITSNFHVPISTYELTWDRLLAGELWGGGVPSEEPARARPILGVACNPRVTPCRVTQVFPDMPAALAGVKVGDVIKRFDDDQVESFSDLSSLVLSKRAGATVKLAIERNGKPITLSVELGEVGREFPGAPELESSFQHERRKGSGV